MKVFHVCIITMCHRFLASLCRLLYCFRIDNAEQQLAATTLVWETYLEYISIKRINEAPTPRGAPIERGICLLL